MLQGLHNLIKHAQLLTNRLHAGQNIKITWFAMFDFLHSFKHIETLLIMGSLENDRFQLALNFVHTTTSHPVIFGP